MRFREALFWDTDPKKLDPKKHARYIIERILDLGNDNEVRWMSQYYSRRVIRDTINRSRVLHPKSRNLWQIVYS